MGAPLQDITIYYFGTAIKDAPQDWDFRNTVNYIADFYHNSLNGYKPPKTGRICIVLGAYKNWDTPNYFGSICKFNGIIDEDKYLSLSKIEQYRYILDLLHTTIMEIGEVYKWEKAPFNMAYDHVIHSNFQFEKRYPVKQSRDRRHTGQIILRKTAETATLNAVITGTEIKEVVLIEKRNWHWYDTTYKMALSCKWIDNLCFGFLKDNKYSFFELTENRVINNLQFGENDL